MLNSTEDSRKYVRYKLQEGAVTQIDLLDDNGTIICSLFALIINSSIGGNELLLMSKFPPFPNQKIQVQFPELGMLQAQIIWARQLEEEVYRLGIEYVN